MMRSLWLAALLLSGALACSSSSTSEPGEDVSGPEALSFDVDESADASDDGDAAAADVPDAHEGGGDAASDSSGEVESGFVYPCDPGQVEACVTACQSAGIRSCMKDWGPCIPPEEFCGNCADDDCDGLINEGCPENPACVEPPEPECPVAIISIAEGGEVGVGTMVHLSAAQSTAPDGAITQWAWSVHAPVGSSAALLPSSDVEAPTFLPDAAGEILFTLEVWDEHGTKSCLPAQAALLAKPFPPETPAVGCADGEREGFVDLDAYTHIAGCSGAWEEPGITPDDVAPTCGLKGGDDADGPEKEGTGCSSADLCAQGWHVCSTWQEVSAKSSTGCAGAVPPGAPNKSHFFAIRQPSFNFSECGEWGDGFNDVFGCGNLGHTLAPDKNCGPLDRALASTQANTCGYNEAEPGHGPWQCPGTGESHLNEGAVVTKNGCPGWSCSYDGQPVGNPDKGGVLCCRD
jgi:hypothetical protein